MTKKKAHVFTATVSFERAVQQANTLAAAVRAESSRIAFHRNPNSGDDPVVAGK